LSGELKLAKADLVSFKAASSQWGDSQLNYDGMLKIKEDYKANVNASGEVPTLVHGDKIIFESDVVAEYLARAFPDHGTQLIPSDPYLQSVMRAFLKTYDVAPMYQLLKNQDPLNDHSLLQKIYKSHSTFVKLADPTGPFFLGANLSLVDCIVAPFYDRFRYTLKYFRGVDYIPSDTKTYPWVARMATWAKALEQQKNFQCTSLGEKAYCDGYTFYAGKRGRSEIISSKSE